MPFPWSMWALLNYWSVGFSVTNMIFPQSLLRYLLCLHLLELFQFLADGTGKFLQPPGRISVAKQNHVLNVENPINSKCSLERKSLQKIIHPKLLHFDL